MTAVAPITVATSIPPKLSRNILGRAVNEEYQRLCLQSWRECGFHILSVNDRDEIADLATRYPDVTFVPTSRNASAISGRKNPFIADLLTALAGTQSPVLGIINADIVFEPAPSWRERLPEMVVGGVVTGQRFDTMSPADGLLEPHPWGYDFFFFDRASALELIDAKLPFAMGLPWWDYWAPLTLALKGRRLATVDRPSIVHLYHNTAYDQVVWRQLGLTFARLIIERCENFPPPLPRALTDVLPLCREFSTFPGVEKFEREDADELIQKLADGCAKSIRLDRVTLACDKDPSLAAAPPGVSGADGRLAPSDIFKSYETRTTAGRASAIGKKLQSEGGINEASIQYLLALRTLPNDAEALFTYGDILARQNDIVQAALVFRKLAELQPEFCNGINAFGALLDRMGRQDEAIACFERVLRMDPIFWAAYFNLALALYKTGRHGEAIARFEAMLTLHPDSASGAETYWRLRQILRPPGARLDEYFSAEGEDALLDEFFGFKSTGRFVDLGTGDGIHFSNSYVFEQRGWDGICVEPATEAYALLAANRPRSRCCNASLEDRQALGELMESAAGIDFLSVDARVGGHSSLAGLDAERLPPRVLLISWKAQVDRSVLDAQLLAFGYRLARSRADSHFYVRNEEDRAALRAITVSAKLAPAAVPLRKQYVHWPPEA